VQLIIFEMKKLFLNKKTLIITMIFIMLPFLINILEEHNKINKYGNAKELYDYCLPFEGSINPEIAAKSKIKTEQYFSNLNSAEYKKATSDTEMYFYIDYNNAASANQRFIAGNKTEDEKNPYSLEKTKRLVERLRSEGKEDSYEYKKQVKHFQFLTNINEPSYYYVEGWEGLLGFLSSGNFVFLSIIFLLVVSPIFSREYASGFDSIILSTKNGRKAVVSAKLVSAVVYAVSTVMIFNLAQLLSYTLVYGIYGFDKPLNSIYMYNLTFLDISIIRYYILQLLIQIIGAIVAVLAICFISSKNKSPLTAFFISFLILYYPGILGMFKGSVKWIRLIVDISIDSVLRANGMFVRYNTLNVLGFPVLAVYIIIPVIVLAGIVAIVFTYNGFINRDVVE